MLRVDAHVHDQLDGFIELDEVSLRDYFRGFAEFIRAHFHQLAGFFRILSNFPRHCFSYPSTSRPMFLAVPITVRTADSRLVVFRSGNLVLAISSTCLRVTFPPLLRFGSADPLTIPAARLSSSEAGGVLVIKVNVRSL